MTNVKKIIKELYIDNHFVENETKEVLDFYMGKTKTPRYFIKNLVDELRIKTIVFNHNPNVQSISLYDVYNNEFYQNKIEEWFTKKYNITNFQRLKDIVGMSSRTWSVVYTDDKNRISYKVPGFYNTDTVYRFLEKYTVEGDNYYDGSCGWGNRLCAALKADVNYFGTDPNKELHDKLSIMYNRFKKITNTKATADIRCQGSEFFISEYENKMDVAFTCPPYFFLEVYTEDQKNLYNMTYDQWLNDFLYKTIDNTVRYLKDGGIYAITVKSFSNYTIFEDTKTYLDKHKDLEFVELMEEELPNQPIRNGSLVETKNIEYIQIYRKKCQTPLVINKRDKTVLEDFLYECRDNSF